MENILFDNIVIVFLTSITLGGCSGKEAEKTVTSKTSPATKQWSKALSNYERFKQNANKERNYFPLFFWKQN